VDCISRSTRSGRACASFEPLKLGWLDLQGFQRRAAFDMHKMLGAKPRPRQAADEKIWRFLLIISFSRKFIFLKTQKTGGTSVEIALSALCGPNDVLTPLALNEEQMRKKNGLTAQNFLIPPRFRPWWARAHHMLGLDQLRSGTEYYNHMSATAIRARMDPALFDSFKKVTIVRNPWDREVSLFYWHTRASRAPQDFGTFVRRWLSNPERKTFKLYSIGGRVVATHILRYETLAEDYERFVRSLGIADPVPLGNAKGGIRSNSARNYRDMYDDATREIVRQRYAREIEAFEYSF
jgi:hypothetical protein